jgi:von Willebrand factor type A domain
MFTRSHARAIRAAITIAFATTAATLVAACSSTQQSGQSNTPTPVFVAKPAAPQVLNLCADPSRPPDAISSKPGYTQMSVIVTDQSGKPISGLDQSDFVVWRDKENLPIVFFRGNRAAAPVSVVVVIDESGSMQAKLVAPPDKLPAIRSKIEAVVEKLNRCDELAMVSAGGAPMNKVPPRGIAVIVGGQTISMSGNPHNREVTVLEPFTTDHLAPMQNLYKFTPYGQTSIYDALDEAIRMLAQAHYRSRAIILVTDGMDNTSTLTEKQAISDALRLGVRIFAVGIGDPSASAESATYTTGPFTVTDESARLDKQSLIPITRDTGGALFVAGDVSKDDGASLAAALRKISDALGSGYSIGVLASGKGPWPHALPNVGVAKNPSAVVRVYAEPAAEPAPSAAQQAHSAAHS